MVVHGLAPTLLVRLTIDVPRADRHPAIRDHSAEVLVCWDPDQEFDLPILSEMAGIRAENHLPVIGEQAETVEIQVGWGRLATVDLTAPDCWEALSQRPDLRLVGQALMGEKFDMAELQASYPLLHHRVLIADYLEIKYLCIAGVDG